MSDNVTIFACITVVVALGFTTIFVHRNERDYQAQRACMAAGGNWETREHSSAIGCRFQFGVKK